MNDSQTIMVVAGELSGDLLGAPLVAQLKEKNPNLNFIGVAGKHMQAEGVKSLFPIEELSLMGIVEVLPHIPKLFGRRDLLIKEAKRQNVQALITIDAPDFNLRVAQKMKNELGIPCIHYVSPSVWAWRKGRAAKMAKYLDHVLALFPFEPDFYKDYNLKCTFVGHPLAERLIKHVPENIHKLQKEMKVALVPGSRRGTVTRMLPLLLESFELLKKDIPSVEAVIPLSGGRSDEIIKKITGGMSGIHLAHADHKFEHLKECRAAIATSGTSNLELAMLGLPMVIAYKISLMSYKIVERLLDIPYASPVNWVAGEKIVNEWIQDEAIPQALFQATTDLMVESDIREKQVADLVMVREKITSRSSSGTASEAAADVVLSYL